MSVLMKKLGLGGSAVAAAVALAACGGGGGDSGGEGRLSVGLTDAPACGYKEVNVTVERVRVHRSDTASDKEGGWEEVVLAQPLRVNLLDLTNGTVKDLGDTTLPAGKYTQLRFVLAPNTGAKPYANSVVLDSGEEIELKTPSGQQSGVKAKLNLDVEPGQWASLVVDFDACKSVVPKGNGGFNLKPQITVIPTVTSGLRVDGLVAEALGVAAGTQVSLQTPAGVVVRATVPAADGKFVLAPVPAGTYNLVVSAEGRVTAVMKGVPVNTTAITYATPGTTFINPPVSNMRAVSGLVQPVPADAMVRALQKLDATTTIEVAGRPANIDTGAYAFRLPAAAPVVATYSATATSLNFTAVPAAAGKYTVEATMEDLLPKTAKIDVTAADVVVPAFKFVP